MLTHKKIKKILFIRLTALGDIVMTFPAIKLIRKNFPDFFLGYVVDEKFSDVLTLLPEIDKIYKVNFYGKDKNWASLSNWEIAVKFIKELRKEKFDVVINFHQMFRAGILGLLSGARYRAYQQTKREFMPFLANEPVNIVYKQHQTLQNINLVSQVFNLGINNIDKIPEIFFLNNISCKENQSIVVSPFTSPARPENRWVLKKFINLINALSDNFEVTIVGTKQDNEDIKKHQNDLSNNVLNLCGKTNIKQLIEVISKCNIFIGNDSGTSHIASFLNKKTIVIFGPANPNLTAPFSKKTYIISKHLNCSPCYGKLDCLKNKPRNFLNDLSEILPCLNSITEEDILKKVLEIANNEE